MSPALSTLNEIPPAAHLLRAAASSKGSGPLRHSDSASSAIEQSAEELASSCRDGSLEAFEALVGRFEARIYNFLLRHVGNAHDAQDLTQETFVRAWRAIHRFDANRDFATWIFVIARRTAANHFRARRIHEEMPEEMASAGPNPSGDAESADESSALWKAARKLKPRHYEALWLRYAEGFSVAETARVMGLTTIHTKVILHRARTQLAKYLRNL
jgi:RNA polymerase sigma-70 factor (ECF subfamily)